MAPKSSQRTSLGSSQPQPFEAAVTKLCNAIDNAKGKKGEIKAQSIVTRLKEFLKDYREARKVLGSDYISLVAGCLENDGDNVCSRLEPAIFCTVVELVLQTEPCIDGERSLFLLAKSIFNDIQDPESEKAVVSRKNKIGRGCRQQLLGYFLNERTAATMRRWAGVLCVQLFQGCEDNCQWLAMGPEDFRRNIGRLVIDEPDEILRIIYAQLVRVLLKADISIENMFPTDFDEVLYADFPPSTQGQLGWGGHFQKYVDGLYAKQLIDTPSIGELVFATSIAMRPEHRFGVHGHTLYVFVYEGEGGHEISILAPSRSTFFDQILDIPMRSIKELTIVIDEFSQIAQAEGTGQIGLEFESGEGNDFFLDSEKIELSSLYLTFQPDNADLFKDALIERCPSIKVAQSDKKAALNPNSSGIQKPSSQVSVIDEVMVGVSNEMQDQEQPSLKLSQGPQLEKNYIRETQAEQGETQKSIDVEDELQSSIDAVVPDPRNNEDDGAAPQTTKEMSKVTPASNVSGFKPPVPPNLKGVKPKAKAPIVARDLRNKPSQASTQEPAVAPQAQTCGKQEQKGSATAAPEKPASQGARGKQKQSEQTSTTQRKTASQAKNVAASSQPQMPPPDSKPHGKTRSARFSQFTDDIEDSKVSDEPKPLSQGTQKASANATKPSASSSQNAPSQTTDARKSKVSVKETTKPSQGRKDPSYQQFSDNYITDVDPIDASTPKVTAAESQARKKTPATSTSNTQTKKLSSLAGTTSQKQKRYSLHPPAKSTPISGDLYDVPPDPDEDEASQKTKGKKSAKAGKSALKAATSAKTTSKTGPKAATKKRQSAPAALGRPTGTRNSQRAAAAKANEQLQGADKSDVEDAELDEQPAPLKSQATKKGKTKAGPDTTKARIAPKEAVDDKVAPVTEEDDEMSPRPQPDALSPSPVPNNAVNHVNADNLYDATPKPPSKKPGSQNPRESTVEDSEAPARVSKAPKKNKPEMKKRNSSLDMASKLGNLLNDVSDNPPETEPQGSIVRKQLLQSDEPIKRKPTTAKNEDAPAVAKSTKSAATNHMEVNSKPNTRVCEVSDSSSLSPTEEHEQEVSTPAPKQVKRFVSQEKSKANDDEIFKKPEIPTHQKKTPNRPDDREPFTAKSNLTEEVTLDEPEQDVATSELVNRVITEAARDAPMEPAHDDQDNAEIGRKRKAELTTITLPKRQRIDENQARAREASPAPSLPSSPPVRAKASPKQSQKSAENMVSPRRSPRLVDRARRAAEVLQQATSEAISAAKDPNRKPHLVTFGVNGALNQGISSTAKVRKDRLSSKNQPQPEEAPKPAHEDVGDKKRKREQLDVVDAETLPSKRRSVSPRETSIIDEYEDGDLPVLQDSSPVEEVKTKSTHNRPSAKPPTRLSSQTSRVDKNGSPLGSSQEDHFGKLQKRLAEDGKGNKSQAPPPARAESPVTVQPRRLSEIFGPRVVLENKPKARKSSPEETAARYIAHEKTANGVYQEVASKQVVALEKKLQDPFTENARKSSGFTERLMSGSSSRKHAKVSKQSEPIMIGGKEKRMPQDDKPGLSLNIPGAPRANLPEPARRTQQAEIRQKTHVEVENQHLFDGSTPSEMTIGASYESNSSEPDRMPLNEKPRAHAVWNIAIRSHYADLHDAVHRIADEVLIRLADEEDKMGLLVEQYKQGGDKILSKLEQRHENQRVAVVDALNQKKVEMVSIYSEAKEFIHETTKDLQENSTVQFEREWRKRQEAIRDEISEGRKVSGL